MFQTPKSKRIRKATAIAAAALIEEQQEQEEDTQVRSAALNNTFKHVYTYLSLSELLSFSNFGIRSRNKRMKTMMANQKKSDKDESASLGFLRLNKSSKPVNRGLFYYVLLVFFLYC